VEIIHGQMFLALQLLRNILNQCKKTQHLTNTDLNTPIGEILLGLGILLWNFNVENVNLHPLKFAINLK